jgi:hypothetical protein
MTTQEITTAQLGRPVNENSVRQIRLREIAANREAGLIKRGRPSIPNSVNYIKNELRLMKQELGLDIKLGRPTNPESARAKRIADLEARRSNGTLKLGRPKVIVIEISTKAIVEIEELMIAE